MSIPVTTVAVKSFDSLVHAEFQSKGFRLRNTMRTRNGVKAETHQFPIINKGMANQKALQDDVTPMNVGYDKKIVTLANWVAPEYSDIFSQAEINFDEKAELAQVCAKAIGRRMDQIAIDAISASSTTLTIGAGGVGFTFDKLRKTRRLLKDKNADDDELFLLISPSAESDLLNEEKLTNAFYINQKVLNEGTLQGQMLMGFRVIVIGDMAEGGIPLVSTTRTNFAWNKSALGYAIGIDFSTEINYIAQKLSYLVASKFRAGAVAIDNNGIVKIDAIES